MKSTSASSGNCEIVMGENGASSPIFTVLVKRTYQIIPGKPAMRAERDRPLTVTDEYYDEGDPQVNSIRFETDLAPFKLATDVVLIGTACAPGAVPVPSIKAAVSIGNHRKELLVTGDRTCEFRAGAAPLFTEPAEFACMDIRYERAYGGSDIRSEPRMPFWYPRNPIGRGFVIKNRKETVDGLRLPNIEDPDEPLTPETLVVDDLNHWNRQPLSQGFGWFHRAWYPRCSFLAAMPAFVPVDEVMREETLGLVPPGQPALARGFRLPSRDSRFYNGASLGLALPYMKGDEEVRLERLTPDGEMTFSLPRETPRVNLDLGFGDRELTPLLHSVTLRSDDRELDLVWGAAHEYPGPEWLPEMKVLKWNVQ
jgi:hypothetical protein